MAQARLLPVTELERLTAEEAEALCPRGSLLVFPTDTVYGLGARPEDPQAVQRLRRLKDRPPPQPFSLHLASVSALGAYVGTLTAAQRRFLAERLPGPVTVLLPASPAAPADAVLEGKIGIRVPGGRVFSRVARAFGPLLGTSVNRRGQPPLNDPELIRARFGAEVALVVASDEPPSGHSSAVVDLTAAPLRVLRGRLDDG